MPYVLNRKDAFCSILKLQTTMAAALKCKTQHYTKKGVGTQPFLMSTTVLLFYIQWH